jgi:hypothetical protein
VTSAAARALLFALAGVARATSALAADPDPHATSRSPMPEPILTESVGDIDGRAGEVEEELNASKWHAPTGGADEVAASAEVEWIATRRLGMRLEPGVVRSQDASLAQRTSAGVSGGLSLRLVNDYDKDFHLQAELGGRYPSDLFEGVEPGEAALPFTFDLRVGFRRGPWTLRAGIGGEAGGTPEHAPVRAGLGLFTPFGSTERYGFWGVEVDADAGRRSPFVVALNLVPTVTPLHLPFRFGFAIPWAVGAESTQPAVGFFVRLFFEAEREIEYGETGRPE